MSVSSSVFSRIQSARRCSSRTDRGRPRSSTSGAVVVIVGWSTAPGRACRHERRCARTRALRYHGREDVRLEEVDEPVAGPGDVILRVAYNGICGSDVHEYFDGPIAASREPHPLTGCAMPCILGHELAGEVVEVGPGVDDVSIGALVAVEPIETCGTCAYCRNGHRHLCRKTAFHGYHRAGGGLSDYTAVRRDMVHPMPD